LGVVIGDNLAVNSVNGFVRSFNSTRFCRVCKRSKQETQFDSHENKDSLRNKTNYYSDLLDNNVKLTGVNSKCILNELANFHVTERFSFDIMHDIFEGVAEYDVCKVIMKIIKTKVLALSTINNRKHLFPFGEIEIGNQYNSLELARLKNCNLNMSASEMKSFLHFLPLMVGDLVPTDNVDWQLILILLKIVDLLFKPELVSEDLSKLEECVKSHHVLYTQLYGALKPKHHFMVHYASAIKKCGPLKYLWSMRFESKLRESKLYTHNIHSRINPPCSNAKKAALKFAKFLINHEVSVEPIFSFSNSLNVALKNIDYFTRIVS